MSVNLSSGWKQRIGAAITLTGVREGITRADKQKTSFIVNEELWKKWILLVVNKRGSARKLSQELEVVMEEYMRNHKTGK